MVNLWSSNYDEILLGKIHIKTLLVWKENLNNNNKIEKKDGVY